MLIAGEASGDMLAAEFTQQNPLLETFSSNSKLIP